MHRWYLYAGNISPWLMNYSVLTVSCVFSTTLRAATAVCIKYTYHINVTDFILKHPKASNGFQGGRRFAPGNNIAMEKVWCPVKTEIYSRVWGLSRAISFPAYTYITSLISRRMWLVGRSTLSEVWNSSFAGWNTVSILFDGTKWPSEISSFQKHCHHSSSKKFESQVSWVR